MAKSGKLLAARAKTISPQREKIPSARKYKQYFLIVCEDEATEPAYFEHFKAIFDKIAKETLFLNAVGTGRDPLGVVQEAVRTRNAIQRAYSREIDFVWVVFDKDDADENQTKRDRFDQAFTLAGQEKIHIAYSNEVFELWLLLHLSNVSAAAPIPRSDIYAQLGSAIRGAGPAFAGFVYEHGKTSILEVIRRIGDEPAAIRKAETLLAAQTGKKPIEANPSTLVHLLVKELRAWIAFYAT